MNLTRLRAVRLPLTLLLAVIGAPAAAQSSPLMRYNTIVESTFLLERCRELTPERRTYVRRLTEIAKRPLEWTPDQWAAHDAALAKDLERLYPSVPKVRCAELVRNLDQEMKNAPSQ